MCIHFIRYPNGITFRGIQVQLNEECFSEAPYRALKQEYCCWAGVVGCWALTFPRTNGQLARLRHSADTAGAAGAGDIAEVLASVGGGVSSVCTHHHHVACKQKKYHLSSDSVIFHCQWLQTTKNIVLRWNIVNWADKHRKKSSPCKREWEWLRCNHDGCSSRWRLWISSCDSWRCSNICSGQHRLWSLGSPVSMQHLAAEMEMAKCGNVFDSLNHNWYLGAGSFLQSKYWNL